jgi:hypothetical protein
MPYNRGAFANRTPPRQAIQTELPRIAVVFCLWQCDEEDQVGVKTRY